MNFSAIRVNGNALTLLFLILLTAIVLRNTLFTHPMADDFCFVLKAHAQNNWFDIVIQEYRSWGGRYTTTAIISLFVLNFDLIQDIWIINFFLILLTLWSFYYFFSAFAHITGNKKDWTSWTVFSCIFYLAAISAMPEVLYWMSGGVTYTGGIAFLLIVVGLLLRLSYASYPKIVFILLFSSLLPLVFITSGFNEVIALLQLLTTGFGTFIAFKHKFRHKYVWLTTFVVAIIGLAIVVGAPGNALRTSALGTSDHRWFTPIYGLYQSLGAILATLIIMHIVTANSYIQKISTRLNNNLHIIFNNLKNQEKLIFLLFIILLYSAVFMPSYWAGGGSPPKRTQTILYVLPLLIWMPYLSLMKGFINYKRVPIFWFSRHQKLVNAISIATLISIALSINIKNIFEDTIWRAGNYDQQLKNRYILIDNAIQQGISEITVPQLTHIPKSLFFTDITPNPTHWNNQCYSAYFKLKSIALTPKQ